MQGLKKTDAILLVPTATCRRVRHSPKICLEPIAFIILYIAHSCMVTLGAASSLIPQNYNIFLFQSSEKELIPGLIDS